MRNLKEYTALLIKSIRLFSWPVGSIYTSTKPTDPHELFGGTWEPIQDTFLWCAGPKHAAGTSGGEEAHTLTVDEMPSHTHMQYVTANPGLGIYDTRQDYVSDKQKLNKYDHIQTGSTGGGKPHNNMPPFRSVYCWHRIA